MSESQMQLPGEPPNRSPQLPPKARVAILSAPDAHLATGSMLA